MKAGTSFRQFSPEYEWVLRPTFFLDMLDLKKIEALLEPIVLSQSCELVACEWATDAGRRVLRVLIDKVGGINLGDCENLSRLINPLLDVEAEIPDRYDLEVSSPGFNRPLRKKADFEKFQGECISLKTRQPLEGRSHFKGLLKEIQENKVLVEIDQKIYEIPWEEISKANLEVDFSKILKNKGKRS